MHPFGYMFLSGYGIFPNQPARVPIYPSAFSDASYIRTEAEKCMDEAYVVPQPVPWQRESPLTRELYHDTSPNGKNRFHCLDPWHTFHLGVGKYWVGCGAMMLQRLLPMRNIEERISEIGSQYRRFCREQKIDPAIRRIDIHTFGGPTDPCGSWNKASVTSNWMMFFEHFCDQWVDSIQPDERLQNWVSFLQVCMLLYVYIIYGFSYYVLWFLINVSQNLYCEFGVCVAVLNFQGLYHLQGWVLNLRLWLPSVWTSSWGRSSPRITFFAGKLLKNWLLTFTFSSGPTSFKPPEPIIWTCDTFPWSQNYMVFTR